MGLIGGDESVANRFDHRRRDRRISAITSDCANEGTFAPYPAHGMDSLSSVVSQFPSSFWSEAPEI
jgi:hypothetical protein